ncbi:MAG: ABC transporter [Deltaproteobacteria bacterium RIFOXYD12_FULL_53_23]|nr:MAG: ABC transporter [Deltaproteobacteria bacterium RIFOXYD12_FULL_53_23]
MNEVIKIKDLSKTYRAGKELFKAVDNVSLAIKGGEFVSIVGHSGSGKTTLLSLMGGLTAPEAGSITVAGEDLQEISDDRLAALRNSTLGFIYQFASLMPTLTALENVLLPTMYSKGGRGRKDAVQLLEEVGLADKAGAYPAELSGGQQRRIAIARAFINEPQIILADEPTGDLDEDTEAEIMGFFRHMNRERGVTFVIVTHNTALAATTNRTFRMTGGRLAVA